MKTLRSTLARFAASALIIGLLTQTTFAAFGFSVSSSDFFSIDYEGSGTITHMNAGPPSHFQVPPTSLLDLNILRASDLRVEVFGSLNGILGIGQRIPPGPPVTFASFSVQPFPSTPWVQVGTGQFGSPIFALNATAAASLQSQMALNGPDKMFLSLQMTSGFLSSGAVSVSSAVREIDIDVKPGNAENTINPKSRGIISVAILTTPDFDASTVDVDSLRFGATASEASVEGSAFDDVDGDGDLDLVLHFRQPTNIACGADVALLRGTSLTGQLIGRWDKVVTVGCK
jgi:hypothetical protein